MSTEYTKTNWQDGDIITADKMNNIENGIKDVEDTTNTLKEELKSISTHTKNLFEGSLEQGNIASGADTDSTANYYVRTDAYTSVDPNAVYTISFDSPTNSIFVYFYGESKSYISTSSRLDSGAEGTTAKRIFTFTTGADVRYIRFKSFGNSGSMMYTPDQVSDVQIEKGNTATAYEKPYTADDTYARHMAEEAHDMINAVSDALPDIVGSTINVFSNNHIEQGNINANGEKTDATYAYFLRTSDYIEVDSEKAVAITLKSPANKIKAFFYDSDHTYISSVEKTLGNEGMAYLYRRVLTATAPSNAVFMMFKVFGSSGTIPYTPDDVSEVEVNLQAFPEPEYTPTTTATDVIARREDYLQYASSDILCLGDSLTEGYYADQSVISGVIAQNYPFYLGRMLNCNVVNGGISGATPATWMAEHPNYDYTQYDTIIVWYGTNGGLSTADVDVSGTATNAYKQLIETIKASNPKCRIILVTVFVTGEITSGVTPYTVDLTNTAIRYIASSHGINHVIDVGDMVYANNPVLHTDSDRNHFTKGGNLYLAHRFVEYMAKNYSLSDVEFGLSQRT